MWELDQKLYFILLIIIPLLGLVILWNKNWKKRATKRFGSGNYLNRLAPDHSSGKPMLKNILILTGILFCIFALVNPKIGTKLETVKREGIDIVFALDVSKSMLAEDIAPNRLEKSKQIAQQIINKLGTDRVGLVAYAASAFPVMPITSDFSIAKNYINELNTDLISSKGTALNQAINVSAQYFEKVNSSKVLILLSDGEDHSEDINTAINIAKDQGLKIITIAVGTPEGGKIPIKKNGQFMGYKKDQKDNEVITKLNEETLKEIAEKTGGVFFYGSETNEVLVLIEKALQKIEKKDFNAQQVANFESQYQWFLALALLLILIDSFLFNRKSKLISSWNLFNEKK